MTAPDPRLNEIQAQVEVAGSFGIRFAIKTDDVAFLLAELRKAHESLERVEGLHKREVIAVHEGYGEEAICTECGHRWPCDTRAAVAAAKGDERG